jgi:hypothetical protein
MSVVNVQADPGEMTNLLDKDNKATADAYSLNGRPVEQIVARLDALTMVLKSCKGRACVEPWKQLHPAGDVTTLSDSLQTAFDAFYNGQPKVFFTDCKLGYLPEFEGPMAFDVHDGDDDSTQRDRSWVSELRKRGSWSAWT